MKKIVLIMASLLLLVGAAATAQDFKADSKNTVITWTGKKVSGKHYGKISLKEGSFTVKNNKIETGNFVIDMSSITVEDLTGDSNAKLLGHLKSDDFFSTTKFTTATLAITGSEVFTNNEALVTGNLTIKGIVKPISFKVKRDGGKFSASVSVDRTLYDIRYGSGKFFDNLGNNMIDDLFVLDVNITAVQ
jgi:polyisoprenoid-binding protein YceI